LLAGIVVAICLPAGRAAAGRAVARWLTALHSIWITSRRSGVAGYLASRASGAAGVTGSILAFVCCCCVDGFTQSDSAIPAAQGQGRHGVRREQLEPLVGELFRSGFLMRSLPPTMTSSRRR
jgi:hypothetical protein